MKRSRFGQRGSDGSKRRCRVQISKAMAASAMGVPGCPAFAFSTASTDNI
jgi:hypothetical protein